MHKEREGTKRNEGNNATNDGRTASSSRTKRERNPLRFRIKVNEPGPCFVGNRDFAKTDLGSVHSWYMGLGCCTRSYKHARMSLALYDTISINHWERSRFRCLAQEWRSNLPFPIRDRIRIPTYIWWSETTNERCVNDTGSFWISGWKQSKVKGLHREKIIFIKNIKFICFAFDDI